MENEKKGYSGEIAGILVAIGGMVLVQFGFSESCSGEIIGKLTPLLGALPGFVTTYIFRQKRGGVTPLGFKKA